VGEHYLGTLSLDEAQQSLADAMDIDCTSRCARPGEPPRNREMRCRHGFVEGKRCLVCGRSLVTERKRLLLQRQLGVLRAISSGSTTRGECAAVLGLPKRTVDSCVTTFRKRGILSPPGEPFRVTDLGREFMKGKANG
jgi:hypothetical protein